MLRSSILSLVVIVSVTACRPGNENTLGKPAAGHVEMTLTCFPDGSLGFALSPWQVTLPAPTAAFTFVNSQNSNVDATVAANDTTFPFGNHKFNAAHGSAIVEKPIPNTPGGHYKYSVTAICSTGGTGMDTTVVDPDMIIPWKIAAGR